MPLFRGTRYPLIGNVSVEDAVEAPFDPTSISDLIGWWDADSSYITKNGSDEVSNWTAREFNDAGDGSDWEQTVSVDQPIWNSTGCAGAPGVDFSGAFMQATGAPDWLDEDPYGKTFIFIIDSPGSLPGGTSYVFSPSGQHRLYFQSTGRISSRIERETTGANTFNSTTGQLENRPSIMMWRINEDVSGGQVSCDIDHYFNGSWENIVNLSSGTGGVKDTFSNTYILGALTAAGSGTLDMVLGHMLVYDKILSETEKTDLSTYFETLMTFD